MLEKKGAVSDAVCVISSVFEPDALNEFFSDYKKLGKEWACVFIKLIDSIPDDYDETPDLAMGFGATISRAGTFKDREKLTKALEPILRRTKVYKKIEDVQDALRLIFTELDRVARERKRGRETEFNTLVMDFV